MRVRWMVLRDMKRMVAIEDSSYSAPWTLETFRRWLKLPTCACMVAVSERDVVLGFAVFEGSKGSLRLVNLAVDPDFRRKGVGSSLVSTLKAKLGSRSFDVDVGDQFTEAHLFLKSQGFVAIKVSKVPLSLGACRYLFRLGGQNGKC